MTTINDAYAAAVDAVIADNGLSRSAFSDVLQTFTNGWSNTEATGWIDALATKYFDLDLVNNGNYSNLRSKIVADGEPLSNDLFVSLGSAVSLLPESAAFNEAIHLKNLRDDRDETVISIATMVSFRPGQTQQVKDAINIGIEALQIQRERLRAEIRDITGDPDSL
jgi:hypothetical protein